MPSKKSICYNKIAESITERNNQIPELLQKILEILNTIVAVNDIENNKIEELKRKIDTITRYQKPYISKMLNELLLQNPINVEIICIISLPNIMKLTLKNLQKKLR